MGVIASTTIMGTPVAESTTRSRGDTLPTFWRGENPSDRSAILACGETTSPDHWSRGLYLAERRELGAFHTLPVCRSERAWVTTSPAPYPRLGPPANCSTSSRNLELFFSFSPARPAVHSRRSQPCSVALFTRIDMHEACAWTTQYRKASTLWPCPASPLRDFGAHDGGSAAACA